MAPSLAAIAFYATEEAAQAVVQDLEGKGFVIKQILTTAAYPHTIGSTDEWGEAPVPASVGLFVSSTVPAQESASADTPHENNQLPPDTSPMEYDSTTPHGHLVIVYSQTKEQAIKVLTSKEPLRLYLY